MKKETELSILKDIRDLLKSKSSEKLILNKSNERFIDCGDYIKDTKTNLMWPKAGSSETMTHEKAEKYCREFDLAGHKDWRLPTVEELFSLVDYTKKDPAIDFIFNCKSNWYWTSTLFSGDSGFAWVVYFGNGDVSWCNRDHDGCVRPVRQY